MGPGEACPFPVTAVVPVKALELAKTRLELPGEHRRALALAFALDTVAALADTAYVAAVLVVTSDPLVRQGVGALGARVTDDRGAGLGAAVREGVRVVSSWHPDAGIAIVPADLPCLTPADVTGVLAEAATGPRQGAFVADRAGTGTTFVVHPSGRRALTRYGPGSAARHAALGLRALPAPAGARHDVDTLDDLRGALVLGTGSRTRAATSTLGLDLAVLAR